MGGSSSISRVLQIALFALGVFLCWRFFITIDVSEVLKYLNNAKIWPLVLVALVSLLVYGFRAARWNLLLKAAEQNDATLYSSFSALSLGYLVSFFIPRFGEILRCGLLKKYKNINFPISLGTVIAERLVDIIMLVLMLVITICVANDRIYKFLVEFLYHPVLEKTSHLSWQYSLLMAILAILIVYILVKLVFHQLHRKAREAVVSVKEGLTSILYLKNPVLFIGYTLGIWLGYFMMTWLWFFMFESTEQVPIHFVFFIFAVGTIGRSIPTQGGGAGAYHFLVLQAFLICGLSESIGQAMAVIIHGGQTIFTLLAAILGLPCLVFVKVKPTNLT